MEGLNAFSKVDITISPPGKDSVDKGGGLDVIFDFKENKRFGLRSGCEMRSSDLGAVDRSVYCMHPALLKLYTETCRKGVQFFWVARNIGAQLHTRRGRSKGIRVT